MSKLFLEIIMATAGSTTRAFADMFTEEELKEKIAEILHAGDLPIVRSWTNFDETMIELMFL